MTGRARRSIAVVARAIPVAIAALVLLAAPPAHPQEGESTAEKIERLKERLEQQMGDEDWDEALKTVRGLRFVLGEEGRREYDEEILRINGELYWRKVKAKKLVARNDTDVLAMLDEFLERFATDEVLRRRAEAMRKSIQKKHGSVIADFEDGLARVTSGEGTITTDPVMEGKQALRWSVIGKKAKGTLTIKCRRKDWTKYDTLHFWIHPKQRGGRLALEAVTSKGNYFECVDDVRWGGWKGFRIPLHGRSSRFRARGRPRWTEIKYFRVRRIGDDDLDIVIDDIRLEKASR